MRYYLHRLGTLHQFDSPRDGPYQKITKEDYEALSYIYEANTRRLLAMQDCHAGETIHILGCGPSLNDFAAKQDWTGKIVIATNYSVLTVPKPTYFMMVDDFRVKPGAAMQAVKDWFDANSEIPCFVNRAMCFNGFVPEQSAILINHVPEPASRLTVLRDDNTPVTTGVYWVNSVVQAAMDMARHMGAVKIVLWGVDYHDRRHNYTGTVADPSDGKGTWNLNKIRRVFADMRPFLVSKHPYVTEDGKTRFKEEPIEVVVANPDSALKVYPQVRPEIAFGVVEETPEPEVVAPGAPPQQRVEPQEFSRSIEFDLDSRNLVIRHSGNGMMVVPFDGIAQFPELVFLKQYIKRMDALGVWSGEEPKAKKTKKAEPKPKPAEPKAKPKPEPKPAKPKTDEPKTDEPKTDEAELLDLVSNIPQSDMGITEDELLNG